MRSGGFQETRYIHGPIFAFAQSVGVQEPFDISNNPDPDLSSRIPDYQRGSHWAIVGKDWDLDG
jgi:hypothetical protein